MMDNIFHIVLSVVSFVVGGLAAYVYLSVTGKLR